MAKNKFLLLGFVILSFTTLLHGARLDTITVTSTCMNLRIKNVVISPESYPAGGVPVLYLLHGAGSDYGSWARAVPDLLKYADQYQMIIVCPDGGNNSWFIDSPVDSTSKYATYISKELVTYVDIKYNTCKIRGVTGASMGGYGAFNLVLNFPKMWDVGGSMAGCLNLETAQNDWGVEEKIGNKTDHKENWNAYSIQNQLKKLKELNKP